VRCSAWSRTGPRPGALERTLAVWLIWRAVAAPTSPTSPARRVAVAVLDVVSRRWLFTLVLAQETSSQIEAAFYHSSRRGAAVRAHRHPAARAAAGRRTEPAEIDGPEADGALVLIAMSDNGPQMRSRSTREFMAACAIMRRFGRPGTPTDQAWIESLFGHVKTDWPHLDKTRDPGELALELDRIRTEYNTARLHAGIRYVTPDDEHHGRGDTIRQARRDGLAAARQARVTYRRTQARNPS